MEQEARRGLRLSPGERDELLAFFSALDRDLEGASARCKQCGSCCGFPRSGLVLFAEALEAAFSSAEGPGWAAGSLERGRCPFQRAGSCTNRAGRPIGCRTYFCAEAGRLDRQDLHERYLRRLRELAIRWGRGVDYRPFLEHLRELARGAGDA